MDTTNDNLLPLAAAARSLRVPRSWLQQETRAGRLPSLICGSRTLVHVPTIARILLGRAKGEPTRGNEGPHAA